MAVSIVGLVFILSLVGYSDANYCVCNTALSDAVLQKNIDYACGNGADCSPILQNGPCYNPNTVKDHCNYAVNSYYQRKGNVLGSCDFGGTATVSPNPPSTASGCVYPSSPSNAGTTPTTGTPTTLTPPASPTTGGGGTGTATPGTFPGSAVPGTPLNPGFGLAPGSGSPFANTESSVKLCKSNTIMLVAVVLICSLF